MADRINKETVKYYLEVLDKYRNTNGLVGESDKNLINQINSSAYDSKEFQELMNKLRHANPLDREKIINEYFDKNNEKDTNPEKEIANTFGVDISKIEHKILDSGIEIFSFYNPENGKQVILENKKDGVSLVEQLKQIQAENTKYQSNNNEKNTTSILNDQRIKENIELKLIPIEEINEYLGQVKNLTVEDYKKLVFIIKNADELHINYINVENLFGLSKDGKIYEARTNSNKELQIGEPNNAIYNESKIDVSDEVNNNELDNAYEDNPNIKEELPEELQEGLSFEELDEEVKEKTIMLYENPDKLEKLPEEEKETYKNNIEIYQKYLLYLEKKEELEKNKHYTKILKKDDNKGYTTMFNLSMILIFVAIAILLISFIRLLNI
mgnify:CR=1 FL=1